MKDLQLIVRGSQSCLEESPLTVFSCCPASPLKWEFDSVQTLMDCAASAIPIELISTPLIGLVSPVTPVGTLIQHTAENLSGLVIAQLCRKGTPILYGGAPSFFDIRYETTPVSPPEVLLIQCAINEIGKYLGLPTQAYLAVSDSKSLDVQAGLETSMGATMAVLSGINSVSGPGLLEYLNTFSIEKLILDNELCSLSRRLSLGISELQDIPFEPILEDLMKEGHLLISEHTRKNFSAAHYLPGPIIDHMDRSRWKSQGSLTLKQRLAHRLQEILETSPASVPDDAMIYDLRERMQFDAKELGMDILPDGLDF
jgi:trimethylamine--corrinoid protein Co-methyltransferase